MCEQLGEVLAVREMSQEDLNDVMFVETKAYPFPWTRSMFETSLSSSDLCLVLHYESELIGYAIVSYVLDEAHLLNICIHPDYQGKGFGRLLLKFLINKAVLNKSNMYFLEVRSSNVHAIELYFSEGFNEVGLRPNYYPAKHGREDAVLMTLDLSVDVTV